MNKKYRLTFEFFDTFEEANNFINTYIKKLNNNKYLYNKYNRNVKALDWTSEDKTENKKIVWYYC